MPRPLSVHRILLTLRTIDRRLARSFQILLEEDLTLFQRQVLSRSIRSQVNRLEATSRAFVDKLLPAIYRRSKSVTASRLARQTGTAVLDSSTERDEQSLGVLQADTRSFFQRTTGQLTLLSAAILTLPTEKVSKERSLQDLFDPINKSVLVEVNGKKWRLHKYTEMLVRHRQAQASREASKNTFLNNNIRIVQISRNGSEHDKCRKHEGRIYSLTGSPVTVGDRTYQPIESTRESGGLFHPNCQHTFSAVNQ